ncbi:MAG: aminoacyl-tRNA hydrolase [Gammaproteobacteria bacterium]
MGILVVGLGNPGEQYAHTRHNAGFWFLDALAAKIGATFANKFHGQFAATPGCRLLRPATFMNESGRAVAAARAYFRLPPENVLVAHDEADLPPGAAKLKFGGGDAGHNGLADISRALGGRGYWRLRLGVGKKSGGDIAGYVLSRASKSERTQIEDAVARALEIWPQIAAGEWQTAMLKLHTPAADIKNAAADTRDENARDGGGNLNGR